MTRRCKTLADTLYSMGIDLFGVAHFAYPVVGSQDRYIINVIIELRESYQIELLDRLPIKWKIHTETCSDDRTQLVIPILAYYETYHYDGVKSADERTQEVIDEFTQYLEGTYDADAVKAVTTLLHS